MTTYAEEVLADSPLIFWRLGEASGTVAADSSGNGHDGTINGSPTLGVPGLLTSDPNTAVTFDGTGDDQYVVSVDDLGNTTYPAFSLEVWCKITTNGLGQTIAAVQTSDQGQWILIWVGGLSGSDLKIYAGFTSEHASTSEHVVVPVDTKHQVVLTYDGTTMAVYLDGEIAGLDFGGSPADPFNPGIGDASYTALDARLYAGGDAAGFGDGAFGTVDEVSFYDHALSDTRVLAHFNARTGITLPPPTGGDFILTQDGRRILLEQDHTKALMTETSTGTPITGGTGSGGGGGTGTGGSGGGTPGDVTAWAATGIVPLADAAAASLVVHVAEFSSRSGNATANNYVPTDGELAAFWASPDDNGDLPAEYSPYYAFVTGRHGLTTPSTDDLIQWASHKWGIPTDWIRAEAVDESNWFQDATGDRETVSPTDYALHPAAGQISPYDVYESLGLMQVKWRPDGSRNAGTEPLRWKSTAFNLDYYAATIRYYFDGMCVWCTPGYVPGDGWKSIGAWFNPSPWNASDAQAYAANVQAILADRTWETF